MKEWISVDDRLPDQAEDIWATDGKHVEQGFRSYVDEDKVHWVDFWFPVSHWMICKDENESEPTPPT